MERAAPVGDTMEWFSPLSELVSTNHMAIFRFPAVDWSTIAYSNASQDDIEPFTAALSRSVVGGFSVPTVGLIFGEGPIGTEAFIGLVASKRPVSTLDSRVKVVSVAPISLDTEYDLLRLVTIREFREELREKLSRLLIHTSLVSMGTELSAHLIAMLANDGENHRSMRAVMAALDTLGVYSDNAALQQDAINLALKAFGLSPTDYASYFESIGDRETSLSNMDAMKFDFSNGQTRIYEDAVIEHDARQIPGFELVRSELTGRATFKRGRERLEIITANKRPLEQAFGVDLIYLNALKQNVVMIQYKMLERHFSGGKVDWIYRPDDQLEREIERMKRFGESHSPGELEYRINSQVFYMNLNSE